MTTYNFNGAQILKQDIVCLNLCENIELIKANIQSSPF